MENQMLEFIPPKNLLNCRDFCRIILPILNLFLLIDQKIRTENEFTPYLSLWELAEQEKTLAYLLCSAQLDEETLHFLLKHIIDTRTANAHFIPEQKTTPTQMWEYFLTLAKGLLHLDMGFFQPSQVGFLCYGGLTQATLHTKQLAELDIQNLLAEFLQNTFEHSVLSPQ